MGPDLFVIVRLLEFELAPTQNELMTWIELTLPGSK